MANTNIRPRSVIAVNPPAIAPQVPTGPTLVQHVATPSTLVDTPITSLIVSLPNPSLAGNLLIMAVTWNAGTRTATVADDQAQSYEEIHSDDANADCSLFYFLNTVAGVQQITVTFNGTIDYVSATVAEFYNVATSSADVTSAIGTGTSASWQATGTIAGNATAGLPYLVFQVGFAGSGTAQPSFAARSGFDLGCAKLPGNATDHGQTPYATQFGVVTASLTNPIITAGTSVAYNTIAVAFKSAAAGTAPTLTPRIVHLQMDNFEETSPVPLQFPCIGTLLVASYLGNQGAVKTTITELVDGHTNGWVQIENSPVENGDAGKHSMWYAVDATTSTDMTMTLTFSGSIVGDCISLMDIVGANAYVAGTGNSAIGNKATTGNLTTVAITPTATGQLVIAMVDHAEGTEYGCVTDGNGHLPTFQLPRWGNENGDAISYFCHDSGLANFRSNDTTAVTFIWSRGATTAPGNWAALGAVFGPA